MLLLLLLLVLLLLARFGDDEALEGGLAHRCYRPGRMDGLFIPSRPSGTGRRFAAVALNFTADNHILSSLYLSPPTHPSLCVFGFNSHLHKPRWLLLALVAPS